MKKYLILFFLCACAFGCAGCAGKAGDSTAQDADTAESAESTVVTTTVTETETTVTTTTMADYLAAKDMKLEIKTDTVRPSKCSAELTNNGDAEHLYTMAYRLYTVGDDDTEQLCSELPSYEGGASSDEKRIAPGGTAELEFDWGKRFGDLSSGTYILELLLERVSADPNDEASPQVWSVARSEFEVDTTGYLPQFIINPDDINPKGIVITVKNAKDVARWYAMTYHLYDESCTPRRELIGDLDRDAQIHGNNYMPPGGELTLVYDWSDTYGSLVDGEYVLEIPLLAEGEKDGKIYRIKFEIS